MSGYRAGDEKVKKFKNCRTIVEFNSISLVRHGSSTTYETGLRKSSPARISSHLCLLFEISLESLTVNIVSPTINKHISLHE